MTPKPKHTPLILGLILLVLGVFVLGWYEYSYKRNFWLYAYVSCDPVEQNCFVEEGEDADPTYFKIIKMKGFAAPICDGWSDGCAELSCDAIDPSRCQEYECSTEASEEFGLDLMCSADE